MTTFDDSAALDLSDDLLNRLTPPLGTFGALAGGGEQFDGDTGPVFDLLSASDTAADVTLGALLHPSRAARLVNYKARNDAALGFDDVLQAIEERAFADAGSRRRQAIARRVQMRFVAQLIDLASNSDAAPEVRAITDAHLRALRNTLSPSLFGGDAAARAHNAWLSRRIEAHLERPADPVSPTAAPETPPGSPIGAEVMETCWHCEAAGE